MSETIKFSFLPPDRPWSTNDDRSLNRYARHDTVAIWKSTTQLEWASFCNRTGRSRVVPDAPSLVRIDIPFAQNRRRDPHNYCGTVLKAVIDGLVLGGAWPDDTHEYLEHLAPVLYVERKGSLRISISPRRDAYIPCDHGSFGICDELDCDGVSVLKF